MGKEKELDLDDQIDSDEELLNFDLDDLSLSGEAGDDLETEEEIIELTDLVERGVSEDITQDLKIRAWAAEGKKEQEEEHAGIPGGDVSGMEAEEVKDAELDLSDISLEPDEEEEESVLSGDEISDADLEGLLREEEGITLDLTEDEPELKTGSGNEISDADLEGLLREEEGITLDLTEDEPEMKTRSGDEISDTDLEGLLLEEEGITLDFTEEEPVVEGESKDQFGEVVDIETFIAEADDQDLGMEEEADSLVISEEEPGLAENKGSEETQALDLRYRAEERLIAEEPIVILEKEAEELGAAAALEDEEIALRDASFGQPEPQREEEVPEETGREREEGKERRFEREAFGGISEERIEEIITNVVREVVERVARKTMADVAERMIGEAIEALKQNIESSES